MAKIIAVLDTNILISALVFGGIPREVFQLVIHNRISGIISPFLLWELEEVLAKKFKFSSAKIRLIEMKLKKKFIAVEPKITIEVLGNNPDNHVLEAAISGDCDYIITGDKELLGLKVFQEINILGAQEFLRLVLN